MTEPIPKPASTASDGATAQNVTHMADDGESSSADKTAEVQSIRRKARNGEMLTTGEKLALFDANKAWIDRLQESELKEWADKGTRITRENRSWTREELYDGSRARQG